MGLPCQKYIRPLCLIMSGGVALIEVPGVFLREKGLEVVFGNQALR
jgi:hypothetical protein